jgi:multiple sugar transport system permease protein
MELTAVAHQSRRSRVGRAVGKHLMAYVIGTAIACMLLFPIFFALVTSLKGPYEVYDLGELWPRVARWSNYAQLEKMVPFVQWIANSLIIALLATIGTVISSFVTAYSFSRFRYPARNLLFQLTLATLMLPVEVTIVPNYLLFRALGWLNTYLPLIVPYWFGGSAFFIFLFRQFMMGVPMEFDEAARIDGANALQILVHVLVPMCRPAIIAATVISFAYQWNQFFTPLVYLTSSDKYTAALGLRQFYDTAVGSGVPQINYMMAAAMLTILPPLILFVFGQKYFVSGSIGSGLKG